jgi:hypothetical protein
VAASEGAPSPIRPNALFVRSEIIKHLSTAKVFSYATSLGAGVMGGSLLPSPPIAPTVLLKTGFSSAQEKRTSTSRVARGLMIVGQASNG